MKLTFRYLVFAAALLSQGGMPPRQRTPQCQSLLRLPRNSPSPGARRRRQACPRSAAKAPLCSMGIRRSLDYIPCCCGSSRTSASCRCRTPNSRFVTILSGTFYVAFGDTFDETKLKALPPGGVYTEPAKTNHFGESRDEPVLVAITGYGPSGTTYATPTTR